MSRAATTRLARAVLTGTAALGTALLLAGPAWAANPIGPSEGERPGRGLSAGATLLLFVVVPLAIVVLTAVLVSLPGVVRAKRYRPNRGWNASPVWFAGPPDPAAAVQDAQLGDLVRGGASGHW